jgi:hypothetical protein
MFCQTYKHNLYTWLLALLPERRQYAYEMYSHSPKPLFYILNQSHKRS